MSNPVALLTRVDADDRDGRRVSVRYCSACFTFHPIRCFHRDRSLPRGYRYVCKMHRSVTRPLRRVTCEKCGAEKGRGGRWHRCQVNP